MPILTFDCVTNGASQKRTFDVRELVLAGRTGRDAEAVRHHVEELQALGVQPPSRTPIFYRCGADLATQTERLQVLGPDTSGEVEYVLLAFDDGLWVTVGSDQTDRKAETIGVALSKQLAGKVIARTCWRLDDVLAGWDGISMRSWAVTDGKREPYQDCTLGQILSPKQLIDGFTGGGALQPGTMMMSGTPAAIGGIRPAGRFEMELADAATGRNIRHGYDIVPVDVVA